MKRDFITILALMMALSSCNDDALFEKEMYKNVVALISSDYYNTFEEVVTLSPTGEEATGYIAACTGGTHAPKQDMVIGLEEDLTSLEFYNRSLYDVDEACYAKFLSSDKYEGSTYLDTELMLVIRSKEINKQLEEGMMEYERVSRQVLEDGTYRDPYHVEPIELTKKRQRKIFLVQHLLGWARYLF